MSGATKPLALAQYIGYLYAAPYVVSNPVYQRLSSVRALANKNTYKNTKINSDDNGTIITFTDPEAVITATFLENLDVSVLDLLLPGTRSNVVGSPTSVTAEPHGTGWVQGTPFKLNYKNGANTIVASIVVKGAGTPLVLNTDYRTYVGDGLNGDLGYTYIVPITANATAITADYSYTPNAAAEFGWTKTQLVMPELIVKIEAIDPVGGVLKKVITLTKCLFNGDYIMDFLSAVQNGNINGTPVAFDLQDGGTFLMHDEILSNP